MTPDELIGFAETIYAYFRIFHAPEASIGKAFKGADLLFYFTKIS